MAPCTSAMGRVIAFQSNNSRRLTRASSNQQNWSILWSIFSISMVLLYFHFVISFQYSMVHCFFFFLNMVLETILMFPFLTTPQTASYIYWKLSPDCIPKQVQLEKQALSCLPSRPGQGTPGPEIHVRIGRWPFCGVLSYHVAPILNTAHPRHFCRGDLLHT